MRFTKAMMTSVVILLISGLSFAAGFLKEGVANEIEETKIAIANDEILVEKINNKISDILIMDHLSLLEARNEIQMAKNLAWEWNLTYNNLTAQETTILTGKIHNSVNTYDNIVTKDSFVGGIHRHFKDLGREDDYPLAEFDSEGFNYSISKSRFEDYDSQYNLSKLVTIEVFLNHYKFRRVAELLPYFPGDEAVDRTWIADLDSWTNLLRAELYEIQQRINNFTVSLASLERDVSFYTFGITAITITTILATAMANRISDKESEKEFSPMKAKILENDEYLIKKTKKWPMLLLFLALILSIAALVIPPIIGILT